MRPNQREEKKKKDSKKLGKSKMWQTNNNSHAHKFLFGNNFKEWIQRKCQQQQHQQQKKIRNTSNRHKQRTKKKEANKQKKNKKSMNSIENKILMSG